MKPNALFVLSLVMFGLSASSFLVMRIYESRIAGWGAVVLGFTAIATMIIPGLQKLRNGKAVKSKA